jgi:hypothetical protein
VIDACRYGDAELVITLPAKLAIMACTLLPESIAAIMAVANRLLPAPATTRTIRPTAVAEPSEWARRA